jgi:hypothetical protein
MARFDRRDVSPVWSLLGKSRHGRMGSKTSLLTDVVEKGLALFGEQ